MTQLKPRDDLEASCIDRISTLLGRDVVAIRGTRGGFSSAKRWVIDTSSGASFFAKAGTTTPSIECLREEAWVYERLRLDCMPVVHAWEDHPSHPILILEDLSDNVWPPPWTSASVDDVLQTIEEFHAMGAPLKPYAEKHGIEYAWWRFIAANPEPFLRLGVMSSTELEGSLPTLVAASDSVSPEGNTVAHFDLRSDNVSIAEKGVKVVDWSHACSGNATLDLGLFLPELSLNGGPPPEVILPNEPEIAAWVAGFFAFHASKPYIPTAPMVRKMQSDVLQHTLPWAVKELSL